MGGCIFVKKAKRVFVWSETTRQEGKRLMNLILNEPCGIEGFSQNDKDGSASCVANQIVKELISPTKLKRIDGKNFDYPVSLIGLNGCWGSGKSNVVELVKKRLPNVEASFLFFEYDFWGHRQDLTRKMFLEELWFFLKENGVDLSGEIKRDLRRLTGRTIERDTQIKLTVSAIVCLSCFTLMPFLNLLARICKDGIASGVSLFALVITGVFAATLIYDFCKGRVLRGTFANLMGSLGGRPTASVDFEYVVEPSVGEFTRLLKKIANVLKRKSKTLVVVLDNMDRLLPEEVVKCLAAVHILFAGKREHRPSNFKVIVPYDAMRVGKLLAKTMDSDVLMSDDYFRRTFDVVYRLSPQLGSGWEQFFDKCYNIVAADDEKAQKGKDEVKKVLDYLVPVAERKPRQLIGILNEIATIRNTMEGVEHIRMKDIAVYVCAWPKCGLRGSYYVCKKENRENEKENKTGTTRESQKTTDDLIVDGGFIENDRYRDFVYGTDVKAKLAVAAIVYQVKDSSEVILRRWICAALVDGKSERMGKLSEMPGFATAFHAAILNDINIGNVNQVPHALEGLKANRQVCWDEFYEIQKDVLIDVHQSGATMLQEFEKIVLKNISDWAGYAQELRNHAEDIPKKLRVAISIESALQEKKQTQVNSVPAKLVSPEEFRSILLVCERQYDLLNVTCDWAAFDKYCAELVGREGFWEHFYPLRFIEHNVAVRLEKTRQGIERCDIPLEMPTLDYYLGVLENISEGIVRCEFDRDVCDAYTTWMADPKNLIQYKLSTNNMECRVVALALRYGGFPWKVKEIDEFINKKNGWESVCAEDELLAMLDHYFSRSDLLRRLQELNRQEPLLRNVMNRLKKGILVNGEYA